MTKTVYIVKQKDTNKYFRSNTSKYGTTINLSDMVDEQTTEQFKSLDEALFQITYYLGGQKKLNVSDLEVIELQITSTPKKSISLIPTELNLFMSAYGLMWRKNEDIKEEVINDFVYSNYRLTPKSFKAELVFNPEDNLQYACGKVHITDLVF